MLDRGGIDAVIISSPVQLHEQMCVEAMEAGCHVIVEKPLSNSLESCERILEAAKKHDRTLTVGFNHRFYPSVKFLKGCLEATKIGRIDHLRVFGGHDGLANFRQDWMYKEVSGGGATMDVGSHMADLAHYIAGDIQEVYSAIDNRVWNVAGSEDNAMAIFKTSEGVPIYYQATWNEWRGYHIYVDVYGDKGMVRAYYAPMFNLLVTMDEPGAARKKTYKTYPEIILREKLFGWQTTTKRTFDDELKEFLRMVKGEAGRMADAWAGFRAVEIANAVQTSSRTGQPVTLRARA